MQKQKTVFSLGDILQKRYIVEDLLGEGGFSTVYLVRDLDAQGESEHDLFALKELCTQDKHERLHFIFEGEILKRCNHPALPHIHHVFDDDETGRVFILLEYIAGPNLEKLRRQQPDQRFTVSEMLTIIAPIVDALRYLHNQQPAIIHRDIKPANIIVPQTGARTVLVDFGIAKEYESDATTTAVRHCSPGYGAPEQYSSVGTDRRTDIYGLAATCYTLLTGNVPIDAFHRTTSLVSKNIDPLVAVNEIVPAVPSHVAQAIASAMSIGQEQRFSTIRAFWQALQGESEPLAISAAPGMQVGRTAKQMPSPPASKSKRLLDRRKHILHIPVFLCIVLFLLISTGSGFWAHVLSDRSTNVIPSNAHPHKTTTIDVTSKPAPTTLPPYIVAQAYNGTVYDVDTRTQTNMSLINMRQHGTSISGSFSGLHRTGTFTGVLDASKHIFFTVGGTSSSPPNFFEGTIRSDGSLVGNYCNIDQAGQCTGSYGIWSVVPVTLQKKEE